MTQRLERKDAEDWNEVNEVGTEVFATLYPAGRTIRTKTMTAAHIREGRAQIGVEAPAGQAIIYVDLCDVEIRRFQ